MKAKGDESLGAVAVCQHGKLGIITAFSKAANNNIYYGRGFDGKFWQSKDPDIKAKNLEVYINDNYTKQNTVQTL